jgi:hypothetical protein
MFKLLISMLAAFTFSVITGCQSRSDRIHFVIPDGFRGGILIYVNQPEGIKLKKNAGVYTCCIPDNGILRIVDDGPFFEWHKVSAAFMNGDPLPVANEPQLLPKETVAFWTYGSRQKGDGPVCVYAFVGTKAENEAFCKATETADLVPGGVRKAEKGNN